MIITIDHNTKQIVASYSHRREPNQADLPPNQYKVADDAPVQMMGTYDPITLQFSPRPPDPKRSELHSDKIKAGIATTEEIQQFLVAHFNL